MIFAARLYRSGTMVADLWRQLLQLKMVAQRSLYDRFSCRRKELTRARELLCDAMFGGTTYGSDLASLDRYFFHFAMAARAGR